MDNHFLKIQGYVLSGRGWLADFVLIKFKYKKSFSGI